MKYQYWDHINIDTEFLLQKTRTKCRLNKQTGVFAFKNRKSLLWNIQDYQKSYDLQVTEPEAVGPRRKP